MSLSDFFFSISFKQIKELLEKKATLLVTDELLDNELRDQTNIKSNFLTQEIHNQVNIRDLLLLLN